MTEHLSPGQRLDWLMRRLGYTQTSLAERAGIGQPTISQIVRGETQNVRMGTWNKLAEALDLPPAYFFTATPAEYIAIRAAQSAPNLHSRPLTDKVSWVLRELGGTWGDEFGPESLAAATGMNKRSVEDLRDGKGTVGGALLDVICHRTGLQKEFFLGPSTGKAPSALPDEALMFAEEMYLRRVSFDTLRRPVQTARQLFPANEEERGN